jgi:hypothetical protein
MVGDLDPFVDDRFFRSCWSIETDRLCFDKWLLLLLRWGVGFVGDGCSEYVWLHQLI